MGERRRLRVLHLTTSGQGSHPYFRALADHLDRARFEMCFASLSDAGQLLDDMSRRSIRTRAFHAETRFDSLFAVPRIAAWIRTERFDVVHTHLIDACLVGLPAARLARTRLVVASAHHSAEVVLHNKPTLHALDALIFRRCAHRVIAPSSYVRSILETHQGVSSARIAVVPFRVDVSTWNKDHAGAQHLRRELGLEDRILFGAVGRLFWIKQYPLMLRAFGAVADRHPEAALIIVGEGPDRAALARIADELGLNDRVVFAGHQANVVTYMSAMDVFVHASATESFGQVFVEAAAMQLPIVSTAVGIAPELVVNGDNGFLVAPTDEQGLAAALSQAIDALPHLREGALRAKNRLFRFSDEAEMVRDHERLYSAWLAEV